LKSNNPDQQKKDYQTNDEHKNEMLASIDDLEYAHIIHMLVTGSPINIKIGENGDRRYMFQNRILNTPHFVQIMGLIRPHENLS